MQKKCLSYIILAIILLGILIPTIKSSETEGWWDKNYSYKQQIRIPIDTSNEHAIYQPIDTRIVFENPCWALNKTHHSIRVIYQLGDIFIELDSQIYELNYSKDNHIASCNIVFLIPKEANGNEKYYVYYDENQKDPATYEKKVDISKSKFYYEPIQGFSLNTNFFKINQGKEIVYAIAIDGQAYDTKTCQDATKLKSGSENILPQNEDHLANFNFEYWWFTDGKWKSISTNEKTISSSIYENGNLMVKCGIVSESKDGYIRSKITYKYYYFPSDIGEKKLYVHAKQEVIKYPLPEGEKINAVYALIRSGGVKSNIIKDLNFGNIFPYFHIYGEDDRIQTYPVDTNPESIDWTTMYSRNDNIDLGSKAWVSVDEGEKGKAHAIIFDSTDIVKSGTDEPNGIELQLIESNVIKLPGIDVRLSLLYLMRNEFEPGEEQDHVMPENYKVEYNAEFFTTENGGYKRVEKEAYIYQTLISNQPKNGDNGNGNDNDERYNLTIYTHISPYLFLKTISSKILFKDTHLSVELYKNNDLIGFGRTSRISFTEDLKIDWKNISLFRKIIFTNNEQSKYLIKVWLENTLFGDRKFVGYAIIDLKEDTIKHIYCKPEGKISIFTYYQDNTPLENVEALLIKNDEVISRVASNSEGKIDITAPCGIGNSYILKLMYKGFLIEKEEINLGYIREFLPIKKEININVHDLILEVFDSKGTKPEFSIDFALESKDMHMPIKLESDETKNGEYIFEKLYPADYTLNIKFKQFDTNKIINIPDTKKLAFNLYDFTAHLKDNWDLPPDAPLDVSLISKELEKNVSLSGEKISNGYDKYKFYDIFPGNYTFRVAYKQHIMEQNVKVPNGETLLIFPAEFNATIQVLDTHGQIINNVKITLSRRGKETEKLVNNQGKATFSIPPGTYKAKIYLDNNLIAERNINIINNKNLVIVTNSEPITPYLVIVVFFILLFIAGIYCFKKKCRLTFLKMLAITLAIVAIISPWWALEGNNQDLGIETSTEMYVSPSELVTIVKTDNITAGELSSLEELDIFDEVIDIIPNLIVVGILFIFSSIFIEKIRKRRIAKLIFTLGFLAIIITSLLFFIAMREFTFILLGSFIGEGSINVDILGENLYQTVQCSWAPSIGFYMILSSVVILIIVTFFEIKNFLKTRKKSIK